MSNTNNPYSANFGVDRAVVQAAMRRARRERNEVVWALLQKIFGPRADQHENEPKRDLGHIANAGVH